MAITAVAALSVALFGLPLAILAGRTYRDQEVLRLERDAISLTRTLDVDPTSPDPVELPAGTGDQIAVYDAHGRLVAGAGPAHADPTVTDARLHGRPSGGSATGMIVTAIPLISRERVTGVVRVARDDDVYTQRVHRAWWGLGGLALAVVLAAALAAWIIARRLTAPLVDVATSARRLGDGDFTVRTRRVDMPEVDAVARALDATAERLGGLVARERAFSADASHQLRTPLAALRIDLEALGLRGIAAPEIDAALQQVDRLQTTIDTLLAAARDDPRAPRAINLDAVLSTLQTEWSRHPRLEERVLHVEVGASHPIARISEGPLREILSVLVSNAIDHGAGAIRVHVRDATGGWLAIDVTDQGPGPDPSHDPFLRREGTGHGIGLALARALADAEGATLTLVRGGPRPTFSLLLPRATAGRTPGETPIGAEA